MIGRVTILVSWCAAALPLAAQEPPTDTPPEAEAAQDAPPTAPAEEAAPQGDQDSGERVRLDLRVSASGPGPTVTVDRGASDGLREGDEVVFRPRDGGVWRGTVLRVDERTARVDLLDPAFVPDPGTRGEVQIPVARLQRPAPADPTPAGDGTEPAETPEGLPPHTGWEDDDSEWTSDLPLLARVRAVRPEERSKQHGGRLTLLADTTLTTEDDRSDAILRLGSDLWVENPFGFGGTMEMDLAFDQYSFDTPDLDDDDVTAFRVDRLSYVLGGTRFARQRLETGRFLQHGMPELGVLDGVEYEQRFPNRHRVGVSFGYMPLSDVEFESFDDFQVAAFYEWVLDAKSDVSVATGAQRTWHEGKPDRDLFVTRFDYIPSEGWDLRGTTWIDLYDSGDPDGSGVDLTHALVSTSRRWENDGIDVMYRHLEFPDLLREEYVESIFEDLADSAYDRVSASWYHETAGSTRLRAAGGLWKDEEERGGDVELGVDVTDAWLAGDDAGVDLFVTRGSYSIDAGMRMRWGLSDESGRWDVAYRFADRHMDEFSHESDDLWEHAVSGSRAFYLAGGWHASLGTELRTFDEELDLSLTLYVQKTF